MSKKLLAMSLVGAACVAPVCADPVANKEVVQVSSISSNINVGYFRASDAMRSSKTGIEAGKELEATRNELTASLQKEGQALEKSMNDFKAKSATMSDTARENEQKKLMKADRDYKGKVEDAETAMKLTMQKTMEALGKEIEQAVAQLAKAKNLDAVIDMDTGRVVYASEKVTYTNDLVASLNKNYDVKVAQNNKNKPKATVKA